MPIGQFLSFRQLIFPVMTRKLLFGAVLQAFPAPFDRDFRFRALSV
jgi:hypothetical protein